MINYQSHQTSRKKILETILLKRNLTCCILPRSVNTEDESANEDRNDEAKNDDTAEYDCMQVTIISCTSHLAWWKGK